MQLTNEDRRWWRNMKLQDQRECVLLPVSNSNPEIGFVPFFRIGKDGSYEPIMRLRLGRGRPPKQLHTGPDECLLPTDPKSR